MNAMLRTPEIVPSLFARGSESDEPVHISPPLATRLAARLASLSEVYRGDGDPVLARFAPALATSSVLLVIVGKPLLKAASIAVGVH